MKAAPFEYRRASTLDEAIGLITDCDGYAKYIAGGQTLGPMLNLRLTQPDRLVDISRIPELRRIAESEDSIIVGAGIRHAEIEDGKVPDPSAGLMRRAAKGLAYRAVRNRGTIGGSLAHADPVAEWPTIMTALNAQVRIKGRNGSREVGIGDFLVTHLTTVLEDDEILEAIAIPKLRPGARTGFWKFCRKSGEFAHSLSAVVLDGRTGARVVLGSAAKKPLLMPRTAAAAESAGSWRDGLEKELRAAFDADIAASGLHLDDYEHHLHASVVARAVREALAR